jgi:hypothetical protein
LAVTPVAGGDAGTRFTLQRLSPAGLVVSRFAPIYRRAPNRASPTARPPVRYCKRCRALGEPGDSCERSGAFLAFGTSRLESVTRVDNRRQCLDESHSVTGGDARRRR